MSNRQTTIDVACFGSAHIDVIAQAAGSLATESSTPGVVTTSAGGVAFNVACNLAALGRGVSLVSRVGDDDEGAAVRRELQRLGIDASHISASSIETGRYVAIETNEGELVTAISDTRAIESARPSEISGEAAELCGCGLWFADANLLPSVLLALADLSGRPPLTLDAVSLAKAPRLGGILSTADYIFCNLGEASEIAGRAAQTTLEAASALLELGARACVVTDGPRAITAGQNGTCVEIPVPPTPVRSVNGAGDALIAASLDRILAGDDLKDAVLEGIAAAARTLATAGDNDHGT